jgi:hypothetical protein
MARNDFPPKSSTVCKLNYFPSPPLRVQVVTPSPRDQYGYVPTPARGHPGASASLAKGKRTASAGRARATYVAGRAAEHQRWQREANKILERHPGWPRLQVARQVKRRLTLKDHERTIARRL